MASAMANVHPSAFVLAFAFVTTACLQPPATSSGSWLKGNMHTHSLWSDGNDFPEMIVDWYRQRGYRFLVLTDHNILSRGEKWMLVSEIVRRGGRKALADYRLTFGEDWVETRGEGKDLAVRLRGLEEFRPRLEQPGKFILIEGEEVSDRFGSLPIHINASNLTELIKPQGGKSVREVIERNLRAIKAQEKKLGRPILGHLNHPNFHYAVTPEDLAHAVSENFFEVYNGHPSVAQLGDANHPSIDRLWDIANTIRVAKLKSHPLFGLAVDDSHNYHNTSGSSPGRGWVMVRGDDLNADSIITAMKRGDFYASSGVTLRDVRYSGEEGLLEIEVDPVPGESYRTEFIGTLVGYDAAVEPVEMKDAGGKVARTLHRYSSDVGKVLAEAKGVSASYKLKGNEYYVRAIVYSNAVPDNPVLKGQVKQAWTQPVGWSKHVR